MPAYDALRQEALSLFGELAAAAEKSAAAKTRRRLEAARGQLADARLMVVVCGEYKRGKSSLLNALLEEPGLFPVDNYYATSITTSVMYGPEEDVTIRLAGPDAPDEVEERHVERADLAQYVTESGNPDNAAGVRHVSIELPNPRLASGLMLVDTPGFGGTFAAHTAATRAILPSAHAIVFVVDKEPMNESERRFLREAARAAGTGRDGDALICVLTKIDLMSDTAEIIANTRAKLAADTGLPEDRVTLVPVSSRAKLDHVASGDEEDLRDSNFAELERVLWGTLARRQARVLLSAALTDLDLSARALLEPLEAEDEALRARLADDASGLASALAGRRDRVVGLETDDPAWRDHLYNQVLSLATKVQETALFGIDAVWKRFDEKYLDDDQLLDDPVRLVDLLREDLVGELAKAKRELDEGAAGLQRRFARINAVDSDLPGIRALPDPPVPEVPTLSKPRPTDQPSEIVRVWKSKKTGARIGMSIGMAAGRTVFTVTLPIPGAGSWLGMGIGGALGGLVGSAVDLVAAARTVTREMKQNELRKALKPWYTRQRNEIKDSVHSSWQEFATAIAAEVDSRLAQALDSAQDAARRVDRASQYTVNEARARQAELVVERAPIERVLTQLADLVKAVGELAPPSRVDEDGSREREVQQP